MSLSDDKSHPMHTLVVLEATDRSGHSKSHRRRWPTVSAASPSLHAPERSARVALAGSVRGEVASAAEAVAAQERFLAYAAHELRGSITLQRTLAEVAIADPNTDTAALRKMGGRVVAACERQERLLEALLTLAQSKCGRLRREPVDLAATAAEVLRAGGPHALRSTTTLEVARTIGDPQLLERLVANLVANAVRHNVPGGSLEIATYTAGGRAIFTIANTGPVIPAGELHRLFQPFQRLGAHAGPSADGVGLGLAIVRAIATSHTATVAAQPRSGGGLGIDVVFPGLD